MTDEAKNGDAVRDHVRHERAARVRAARAFADVEQSVFAELFGVSIITIKRMERGKRDISLEELYAVADRCKVPRHFMDHGFGDDARPATTTDLAELRQAFDARIVELAQALLTRDAAQQVARESLSGLLGVSEQAPAPD